MKLWGVSQVKDHLESLELNPWRVLVIAAHPGDIEYGPSAAVAAWTKMGAEVIYLVATRGELSMPGVEPDSAALIRSGEQSAAARAVGVQLVDFLDIDDGTVEPTVSLRRAIVGDIRRFRPDIVMVMNHREHEADGSRNNPDHRSVGTAALDAVGAAANQWVFRDIGESHTVDDVLVAGSPTPTHIIDVSGFEDASVDAFQSHEQHLASIAGHPMADSTWVTASLQAASSQLPGSSAAVAVERIDYGQGRPCHSSVFKEFTDTEGHFRAMRLPGKAKKTKSPARARNAAPSAPKSKKSSKAAKAEPANTTTPPSGAMKLKAQLVQRGRSIGFEVPTNVMERLGTDKRPKVGVEIDNTAFDTTIGTSSGVHFIAINAERRKAAAIGIDDAFFVTLAPLSDSAAAPDAAPADASELADPSAFTKANAGEVPTPKRKHRKRSSGSRSKG